MQTHLLRLRDGLRSAVHIRIGGHLRGRGGGQEGVAAQPGPPVSASILPPSLPPPPLFPILPRPTGRSLPASPPGPRYIPYPIHPLDPYPLQPLPSGI